MPALTCSRPHAIWEHNSGAGQDVAAGVEEATRLVWADIHAIPFQPAAHLLLDGLYVTFLLQALVQHAQRYHIGRCYVRQDPPINHDALQCAGQRAWAGVRARVVSWADM